MKKQNIIVATIIILSLVAVAHQYSLDNLVMVQSAIIREDADWTAGITSVSHLSVEDKKRLSGAIIVPPPPDAIIVSRPPTLAVTAVDPSTFDWRDKDGSNWVTPIKDQGTCGSCWAFAAIAAEESAVLIHTDNPDVNIDLSEQHLVSDCCDAGTCEGGCPECALRCIRDSGVPSESCFPYIGADSSCTPCENWMHNAYRMEDLVWITPTKENFKWALQEYGPITAMINVTEDLYYYRSGVYSSIWTSEAFGVSNHAVLLIGWEDHNDCWIIKNSWGTGWGEAGYGRVAYGNIERHAHSAAVLNPIIPTSDPGIDDVTDTITLDKDTYALGETVHATASGTNHGNTAWTGRVEFLTVNPGQAIVYDTVVVEDVTVAAHETKEVSAEFNLPTDTQYLGWWRISSLWFDDDGNLVAKSMIMI